MPILHRFEMRLFIDPALAAASAATTLCVKANLQLSFAMANETAIVDAEDLKKRASALRRFL